MTGCARNQRTVARLIAAINDIDGVTRVLVSNSAKPESDRDGTPARRRRADDDAVVTTCAIRDSYPAFELVAAFDDTWSPTELRSRPRRGHDGRRPPTTAARNRRHHASRDRHHFDHARDDHSRGR